jgi:hypothetical protein
MSFFRKALLVLFVLPLAGCGLGDLMAFTCQFMSNGDHCYQNAAVQDADPYGCEKVSGKDFKDTGSNPPRDKCYLQIAENTNDYNVCKNIKGGLMSYTQEECVTDIAVNTEDPAGCKHLTGAEFNSCKATLGASITVDKLNDINAEVDAAKSAAGANPDDKDAQDNLKKLLAKQSGLFDFAPDAVKGSFFKTSREEIMSSVSDEDVKGQISKDFTDWRNKNPGMSLNDQLGKMKEIKDQQELSKSLDEQANTLMDQIKGGATDFANQTADDLYGKDAEAFQKAMADKTKAFLEDQGGQRMKDGIASLEYLKGKYDKASEQYDAINKQVDKLKKVYNEAMDVYNKVEGINKLVAEGKIDVGRAKVLTGAVYLGKGLEYATGYVPVFGSTISTISKATFDVTIKFATKRAERTTSLDKCIDDPEHCDPNSISAY